MVLWDVTRAMGESSTCVSCLHKQMPFVPSWSEVRTNTLDFRTNTSDFRTSTSDLRRYRPILRPISFIVRYYHSFQYHSVYQVMSTGSLPHTTVQQFQKSLEDWHLTIDCIKGYYICTKLYLTVLYYLTPYYRPY